MSKQKIQLSDHFDYSRLIRFVLPCIGTMLFTSIYGIVDGLCVSNFVGKTAFAAVNLIMPVPMLVGTVGFMLGTGGSAIVGITLGEGDKARADRYFSLFMSTALIAGIVLAVFQPFMQFGCCFEQQEYPPEQHNQVATREGKIHHGK